MPSLASSSLAQWTSRRPSRRALLANGFRALCADVASALRGQWRERVRLVRTTPADHAVRTRGIPMRDAGRAQVGLGLEAGRARRNGRGAADEVVQLPLHARYSDNDDRKRRGPGGRGSAPAPREPAVSAWLASRGRRHVRHSFLRTRLLFGRPSDELARLLQALERLGGRDGGCCRRCVAPRQRQDVLGVRHRARDPASRRAHTSVRQRADDRSDDGRDWTARAVHVISS